MCVCACCCPRFVLHSVTDRESERGKECFVYFVVRPISGLTFLYVGYPLRTREMMKTRTGKCVIFSERETAQLLCGRMLLTKSTSSLLVQCVPHPRFTNVSVGGRCVFPFSFLEAVPHQRFFVVER